MKRQIARYVVVIWAIAMPALSQVARIIDDSSTGSRWILHPDPSHPGGPGKLTRLDNDAGKTVRANRREPLVIHAGESVVVEDVTNAVRVHLDGVALRPAAEGEALDVRLKSNGWILLAIAEAPGRARLASEAVQ